MLEKEILGLIVERLNLEDIDIENFDYDSPLFASEENSILALDSVDVLELVVVLKKTYSIHVVAQEMKELNTVRKVAQFVEQKQKESKENE